MIKLKFMYWAFPTMKDPITPIVPQPPRCKCVNLSFYEDNSFYIWHKSRLLYLLSLVSQLFVQLLFSQIPPNVSQLINVRNKTIISSPIKHIKGCWNLCVTFKRRLYRSRRPRRTKSQLILVLWKLVSSICHLIFFTRVYAFFGHWTPVHVGPEFVENWSGCFFLKSIFCSVFLQSAPSSRIFWALFICCQK